MKKFTALALVAGLSAAGTAQAQPYELEYDDTTGNVTLKVYGQIISYVLEGGPFLAGNHTLTGISIENTEVAPATFFPIKTGLSTSDPIQVFEASNLDRINGELNSFGNPREALVGASGPYPVALDIGNILPPGLTLAEVADYVSVNNIYNVDQGSPAQSFIITPEPSSLALLGLGGLFVARRRRA